MIDGMGLDSDSRGAKVGKTGPMIFDDLDISTTRSPRLPARLKRLPRRCQPEAMIQRYWQSKISLFPMAFSVSLMAGRNS